MSRVIFNKQTLSYALYDWATSPMTALHTTFVFAVYFTTAILPDGGTVAWGRMITIAAIIVAILAPIAGTFADRHGLWKVLLMVMTLGGVISSAALWWAEPTASIAVMALILSAIIIITTELGGIFYNALLPSVSTPKTIGRISGFSWGLGYIGAIVCLTLVLVFFIRPEVVPFALPFTLDKDSSEHIRIIMPLAALWLFIFTIPLLLYVPEGKKSAGDFTANFTQGFRAVLDTPGLLRFIIARMFYADAFVTLFAFGGIFAAKVFGFSEIDILVFAIVLNITAGIGAIAGGVFDDRFGSIATIRASVIIMVIAGLVIIASMSPILFWIFGGILGIFIGPVQSASRSHIARMAPKGTAARVFGFTTLTGKATAFIGPLIYTQIVLISGQDRYGMLAVIGLMVISLVLLKAPPSDSPKKSQTKKS